MDKSINRVNDGYCNTIWEFDIKSRKIYVHYDKNMPNMTDNTYDISEIGKIYKENFLKGVNVKVWDSNLSQQALLDFGKSPDELKEFMLYFKNSNNEPQWHRVVIEQHCKDKIIISGKNIYENIKERALLNTAENVFDNIVYIDAENKTYMFHSADNAMVADNGITSYDDMIKLFAQNCVVKEEIESFIYGTKIDRVKYCLNNDIKYIVYVTTTLNEKLMYKKMVFSYLDDSRKIISLVIIDVSDTVKEYERQLKYYKRQSYRDALTGAYNRKFFEENIKKSVRPKGVSIIDLDDFKLCNDVYGHKAGDKVLYTVVKAIELCLDKDDILIRYGGDEFVIVFNDIDSDRFEEKLIHIQSAINCTVVDEYPQIKLSVSMGGVLTNDGETVGEATERADRHMYRAKNQKNMIVTEKNALRETNKTGLYFDKDELKQQILVVDDSEINRGILSEMLKGDFRILEASNGEECIDMLKQYGAGISLVLLDIIMPVADGFEVLAFMNKNNMMDDIPVIMISGDDSDAFIKRAYSMGVSDYINRPFDSRVVYRRVLNTIKLYSKQRRLISLVTKQAHDKDKNNRVMVNILSHIIEFRNGENALHALNINKLTGLLLERLIQKTDKYNLSWNDRDLITTASALHDIGKLAIDEKIVNKPGKLTDDEYEIIKQHTVLGAAMLENIKEFKEEKLVKTAIEICRWHHERYDGHGYPDGLTGDEIPVSAQVVSIADVYDALVSKRVYKDAYSHEKAIDMILSGECGVFNPVLMDCLIDIQDSIKNKNIF